jgi:hypothetical protein
MFIVEILIRQQGVRFLLLGVLFLFVFAAATAQADTAAKPGGDKRAAKTSPAGMVSYDKASDRLNVVADEASLKTVLGRIAQQSGIEVLFDDMAEESVSLDVKSETLESGLKQILRGRNHMMRYGRNDQQQQILIGVMVLPVGESDSGRARRIVAMDDEAVYRARRTPSLEQVQRMDMASERWRVRLSELPPQAREKLEKNVEKKIRRQAQLDQRRAEKLKQRQQWMAEREAEQLKMKEKAFQSFSPEQRADYERRTAESRAQVKSILFDGRN